MAAKNRVKMYVTIVIFALFAFVFFFDSNNSSEYKFARKFIQQNPQVNNQIVYVDDDYFALINTTKNLQG